MIECRCVEIIDYAGHIGLFTSCLVLGSRHWSSSRLPPTRKAKDGFSANHCFQRWILSKKNGDISKAPDSTIQRKQFLSLRPA